MITQIEFVTNRQWDSCARRIVHKNIKEKGQSLSATGIARRANSFIVDIRSDQKGMLVRVGWREAMASTGHSVKAESA